MRYQMSKFSHVFFASDFDHTLTDPHGAIPKANIEAISYFIANGGIFTVASGRSIPMFGSRHKAVPVNAPCILYNGAACYDYAAEKLLYAYPLDDFTLEIIRKIRREQPSLTVEIQGQTHHYVTGESGWRENFLRSQSVPFLRCPDEAAPKPWMKLVICDGQWKTGSDNPKDVSAEDAARFVALQKELTQFCGERCYVTRSMPTIIEIGNPAGNKGKAARALADGFGRSFLVCAGDAPNDETMLRQADLAFAPQDRDAGLQGDFFTETGPCAQGCVAEAIAALDRMF